MSGQCKAECMMDNHADRSLGIIVYPDGSQAEIIQRHVDAPIWETWTEIKPIKRARRLTFAPFHLLVGLSLLLVGCASLRSNIVTTGEKDYCLADFREQTRSCEYDSYRECMAAIEERGYCHPRSK